MGNIDDERMFLFTKKKEWSTDKVHEEQSTIAETLSKVYKGNTMIAMIWWVASDEEDRLLLL